MQTDDERVDIVDTNNRVLYQTTKSGAHRQGLLHRTVIAEVIDTNGKWLMVKQTASRQDPGQYVSPVGGHVRAGEQTDDALKREAQEELGIHDFEFKYIGKCIFNRKVRDHVENHYFILYEVYSNKEVRLNEESESWRKFTLKEIKRLLKTKPQLFGTAFHVIIKKIYHGFT